jgi:hypothetical protein
VPCAVRRALRLAQFAVRCAVPVRCAVRRALRPSGVAPFVPCALSDDRYVDSSAARMAPATRVHSSASAVS